MTETATCGFLRDRVTGQWAFVDPANPKVVQFHDLPNPPQGGWELFDFGQIDPTLGFRLLTARDAQRRLSMNSLGGFEAKDLNYDGRDEQMYLVDMPKDFVVTVCYARHVEGEFGAHSPIPNFFIVVPKS